MARYQEKFIHLIVIVAIVCASILDFKIQAVPDISLLSQSININSLDDGISNTDGDDTSKTSSTYLDDPEESKYFIPLSANEWILSAIGKPIYLVDLIVAAKNLLFDFFLARAPPTVI